MQFRYGYQTDADRLSADLLRVVDFLKEHGAEAVSNIVVSCYPWRNGKRLQAVNGEGIIRPVPFDAERGEVVIDAANEQLPREKLTIRERPDELGKIGLASAFDYDD